MACCALLPRTQALIPPLSRTWRWLVGTYVGCLWALWAMYSSGGLLVPMLAILALLTLSATYVHANPYFGYAGLVAAFTAPIIVVGYDWSSGGGGGQDVAHEACAPLWGSIPPPAAQPALST